MCLGSIAVTVRPLENPAVNLYSLSTTVEPAGPEVLTDQGEKLQPRALCSALVNNWSYFIFQSPVLHLLSLFLIRGF